MTSQEVKLVVWRSTEWELPTKHNMNFLSDYQCQETQRSSTGIGCHDFTGSEISSVEVYRVGTPH